MTVTIASEYQSNQTQDHRTAHVDSQQIEVSGLLANTESEVARVDMRTFRRADIGVLIPQQTSLEVVCKLIAYGTQDATIGVQITSLTLNQSVRYDETNTEALASATATKNYRPAWVGVSLTANANLAQGSKVQLTVTRRW